MAMIMVFSSRTELLSPLEIEKSLTDLLGLHCAIKVAEELVEVTEYKDANREFVEGTIYVDLPDLEVDEGEPLVSFRAASRLDRDEPLQNFIAEILEQEPSLGEQINGNTRDIILHADETSAGLDALSAIAYAVAAELEGALLLRTAEEEDDTVWFDDPEEFADFAFGDEDDDEEGLVEPDDEEP